MSYNGTGGGIRLTACAPNCASLPVTISRPAVPNQWELAVVSGVCDREPGVFIMRVLIGIILGDVITVGGAYLYDSSHAVTNSDSAAQRPMVNWDVVGNKWNHLTARARAEWSRLASKT